MKLGIFAKTFPGDTDTNMAAVAAAGFPAVQYNLSITGNDTVPATLDDYVIDAIAGAATREGIHLAAISGTFNAAHPDAAVRQQWVDRFPVLANAAARLHIPVITLSSGSRDADDMWRFHPDNATDEAWRDSRDTLEKLAGIAEEHGIDIAFEPEHTNVVSTADLARRMLDEVGSPRLKIVFDAANLLDTDDLSVPTIQRVVTQALDVLAPDLALAHAKELIPGRAEVAPGEGALPWPFIIDELARVGYDGTVVTHGLAASGAETAVRTLRPLLDRQA
jgi:sugar phosphate isomerase/epimerase